MSLEKRVKAQRKESNFQIRERQAYAGLLRSHALGVDYTSVAALFLHRQTWVVGPRPEEQSPQRLVAKHSANLSESEERQQQDKAHNARRQQAPRIPSQQRWQAIHQSLSMPKPHRNALDDVETNEHHGKNQAFVQDGIDERPMLKPRSQMKMLTDEQDLCKNEGVDNRKGVFLSVQVMLRENQALVDRQQPEDHPKIKEDDKEAPELDGGFFF
jgi:hypothetical protein